MGSSSTVSSSELRLQLQQQQDTHTHTHGCLWEMERHNTENLIVSADRAEQGNEPEIGLGLTEKCAVVSARERTWGFARVKKKKTRSEGTWPWMSETDVINQKTFLGNYFPFHHTPQSLLIYHTSRPCAFMRVCADKWPMTARWTFAYAKNTFDEAGDVFQKWMQQPRTQSSASGELVAIPNYIHRRPTKKKGKKKGAQKRFRTLSPAMTLW